MWETWTPSQGAQEAGKHLTWILRVILKVSQILPALCSLVQLLGLGGGGRDRKLIIRKTMGCSCCAPVVVHPFVRGCWYAILQHGLDLGILTAGPEGVDCRVDSPGGRQR